MSGELEPGAPVARLGAGRLHQDVARVVVQVEALKHDAVEVEAVAVEELELMDVSFVPISSVRNSYLQKSWNHGLIILHYQQTNQRTYLLFM